MPTPRQSEALCLELSDVGLTLAPCRARRELHRARPSALALSHGASPVSVDAPLLELDLVPRPPAHVARRTRIDVSLNTDSGDTIALLLRGSELAAPRAPLAVEAVTPAVSDRRHHAGATHRGVRVVDGVHHSDRYEERSPRSTTVRQPVAPVAHACVQRRPRYAMRLSLGGGERVTDPKRYGRNTAVDCDRGAMSSTREVIGPLSSRRERRQLR